MVEEAPETCGDENEEIREHISAMQIMVTLNFEE
jgi:hypothetical protein